MVFIYISFPSLPSFLAPLLSPSFSFFPSFHSLTGSIWVKEVWPSSWGWTGTSISWASYPSSLPPSSFSEGPISCDALVVLFFLSCVCVCVSSRGFYRAELYTIAQKRKKKSLFCYHFSSLHPSSIVLFFSSFMFIFKMFLLERGGDRIFESSFILLVK